jgi:hypothetical protein
MFGYYASLFNPLFIKMDENANAVRGLWLEAIDRCQGIGYCPRIFNFTILRWRNL